jgi:hypothetical protein
MQKEFKQTGIYFTDEAQDGQDFDGLRTKDKSKLWQFDYAAIPLTLKKVYSDIPSTHLIIERSDFLEAYYLNRVCKLFNVTDNVPISGSLLETNSTNDITSYIFSTDIKSNFPSKEITLGLRIRSETEGNMVSVFRANLFIYKK